MSARRNSTPVAGPIVGALRLLRLFGAGLALTMATLALVVGSQMAGGADQGSESASEATRAAAVLVMALAGVCGMLVVAWRLGRTAERNIDAGQARTEAILDAANEAFVATDSAGVVTEWNAQAEALFGWPAPEAIGRQLSGLIIPPDLRQVHEVGLGHFLASASAPVPNRRIEARAMRRDGGEFPAEVAIWAVEAAGGVSFNSIIVDISERRRAEERLALSERRLADAQATAGLGSWEWDVVADVAAWSEQQYRIYGLPIGSPVDFGVYLGLVHPEDRERVQRIIEVALEDHLPFEFEHRIVRADGVERVHQAKGEVVVDAAGAVVTMRGIGQDVTETKAAERETARLATNLHLLLESVAEGVWGVDLEGRFTFVNAAAAAMWGWSAAELIGRDAHSLVHHAHPNTTPYPAGECPVLLAVSTGRPRHRDSEVLWRRDGSSFPVSYAAHPLVHDGVVEGAVVTFTDITERLVAEEALSVAQTRLQRLATSDVLTGLANRALFADRLDHALASARRSGGQVAVLFMDLDRFKEVNDSLGHHHGDELLVGVAERLVSATRMGDTVARLGGDEFAVLLAGPTSGDHATAVAARVLGEFARPFLTAGVDIEVGVSIGIAIWPTDCDTSAELLQYADVAMYRAKALGGSRFELHHPEAAGAARARLQSHAELHRAVEEEEFFLRYHPQLNLVSGQVVGVEALVRWAHPSRGEVGPAEFIAMAEETGRIAALGAWVLGEACRRAAAWNGPGRPPLRMAVNVSPRQLVRPDFVAVVAETLAATGLDPSLLELEITEGVLVSHDDPAATALKELRALGVGLAIDDFGTGYSSLSYLRRFPVDRLKLDMSFVADLDAAEAPIRSRATALVAATVNLAHALELEAVAEGVESDHQRQTLAELGCDLGQGYLWAKPLRADELDAWLEARRV